jgi:hypothetical protein
MKEVKMTPEEFAEFQAFRQEKEKKNKKGRIERDRQSYKDLKDEVIRKSFKRMKGVSDMMLENMNAVFDDFSVLIEMKDDLYKTKSDRNSNTFNTEDDGITFKLGNRINEGWSDTVDAGVQKVKDYLKTMAKDENSGNLVDAVMGLLSKDRKGNLKASRVLELERLAVKSGNEDFIDGINIIKAAYRPEPSCRFIEIRFKDDEGKERSLPLSMSAFN